MKKLAIFLVGTIGLFTSFIIFESSPKSTLITIANEAVSTEEFLYAFNKNRAPDATVTRDELDEYLQLYINFKLKVVEAKSRGMDTTAIFLKEYQSYLNQLDNSYLQADNDSEFLVKEAYERSLYEISAAHILFTLNESASPADTLKTYSKAIQIRDSIIQGASFEYMAVAFSQDPSAKKNKGNLGYFSVFSMVYPFETAAYTIELGSISMPTRTRFGYHLIQVNDRRPNEGKVKVAHIMIRNGDTAKEKAFELYDQLVAGANWQELCEQNSDDSQSASRAGVLTPFSKNQIAAEFSQAAFTLKEVNELSDPVKTAYGWHIIKLIERLPVGDFKSNEKQLRAKIRRDIRSNLSKQKMVERLATANNFIENTENVQMVITPANHQYLDNKWVFAADTTTGIELFLIADNTYLAMNFYKFVENASQQIKTKEYLYQEYKKFKEESILNYEKAHLADKYDDYRYLRQEYYEGILLFSIMENEVWAKAGEDSLGLAEYYKLNANDFIDTTRIGVVIYSTKNQAIIDSISLQFPDADAYLNTSQKEKQALLTHFNKTSQLSLQLDSGKFVIAEHHVLQKLTLPYKATVLEDDENWYYVLPLTDPMAPLPLQEVKGKLMAGYQVVLETRWLEELKKKYPVSVKKTNLKKLYKKFEIQI